MSLVCLAATAACSGGHAHPSASASATTHPPAAQSGSQRFVYDVVDSSSGTAHETTTVVDVADPYVARVVNRAGPPPGGAVLGGSAWGRSGLLTLSADGTARQAQQVAPGFTGGDVRLDVALPLAARLGWVHRLPGLTVPGQSCTGWESGPPLDSGAIAPPTATERTDSCVDATGRIVSDRWTHNGRLLRTRRLVSRGGGPRLSADGLDPGVTPAPLPEGTSTQLVRPVDPSKLAGLMGVALPLAPAGLALDRSTALASVLPDGSAQQEGASFTYLGGGHLTVVTFVRFLEGAARPPTRGQVLRLPRATGRIAPVVEGIQVDLVTRTGLALTVQTDLTVDALRRWLDALVLP